MTDNVATTDPISFCETDIAAAMAPASLQRGRDYRRDGRVRSASYIAPNRIEGEVEGSGRRVYAQTITLQAGPGGRTFISGRCSCPMDHNCKHVGAVLLTAMRQPPDHSDGPVGVRPDRSSPGERGHAAASGVLTSPARPAALSPEVAFWLDRLRDEGEELGDDYPPEIAHRLIYVLSESAVHNGSVPAVTLSLVTTRLLKDGRFSNSTSTYSPETYLNARPAKYLRAKDHRILRAINAVPRTLVSDRARILASEPGADILAEILGTGRARWRAIDGPALSAGPPVEASFAWIATDDGRIRPQLSPRPSGEEGGPDLHYLKSVPPLYVDVSAGLMGPVHTGLPARQAHTFLEAPAIAAAESAAVAAIIEARGGVIAAAAPPTLAEPILVSGPPTPLLRLMNVELPMDFRVRSYAFFGVPATEEVTVARLAFRYDGVEIPAALQDRVLTRIRDRQPVEIRRQVDAERQAVRQLRASGLAPLALWREHLPAGAACDFAPEDEEIGWLDVLYDELPHLAKQGWEVVVEESFPFDLVRPDGPLDAEVREGSGVDWFEFDLGVTIDGTRFDLVGPLLELIASDAFGSALRQAGGEADGPLYLPLPDGRIVALPADRLVPIVLELIDLFTALGHGSKARRLRFSAVDAAALARLESATAEAGVVWRGGERIRALGAALRDHGGIPEAELPSWFAAKLRPYQQRGVAWLSFLRAAGMGGVLADDMGLGKTVQALALVAIEKAAGRLSSPALVVAPTSLMANWRREAETFAPELRVLTLHGPGRRTLVGDIETSDIVLTTYPLLARDEDILAARDWHMIVLDEAQTIKNPKAATTRIVHALKAPHRFCLTGTPLENNLGELWSLFRFAAPGFLGDFRSFTASWRTPIEKKGDAARAKALARRVKPFLLRRTKAEVAGDLPPKTIITERIELVGPQGDLYEAIRLSMHGRVRDAIAEKGFARSRIVVLEALLKLRQACCDPRLVQHSGKAGTRAASAKLERLMEITKELVAEGRKVLVFSQFTSMLDLIRPRLEAAGIGYAQLTGRTRRREDAVRAFQDGDVPVFLVSLKAGGTGLNLTAADTVILYDPWWNPAVEEQAIDRAHRIGQNKPVFVHRLVAAGTIEEKMDVLKEKKRALAQSLFDHDGHPTEAITEADIEMLFAAD
ncbi:DEAD/DEAH box helicase [Aurantimonas sp. A2-1-M11]|uniref:DEAD/DEAH box helicase n=1 Tax=Aurantimonas sp. A2-1-M11 TaxID=3113712 RepID=UPI002F926DDD